ncbi:unnamed protein product [Blepharisma stoltei]|uniref:Ribosomal protein L33 n=1 Tax=Blepharisma stoltei TaxID=1481888 RepID=A0AAU9J9I0_9CILI|nr:unnamed protein product [Blepharisma stoltei]
MKKLKSDTIISQVKNIQECKMCCIKNQRSLWFNSRIKEKLNKMKEKDNHSILKHKFSYKCSRKYLIIL